MNSHFDLQSRLDAVYSQYPEAGCQPVIGITGNYDDLTCKLGEGYYKSVLAAGGVPLIIPPIADTDTILNTLDRVDALILSGGADFNPLWAGEEPSPLLHGINQERDLPELLITRLAYNRQIPILGICRGIQTLAMALGGRVMQDISAKATVSVSIKDWGNDTYTYHVNGDKTPASYEQVEDQLIGLLSQEEDPTFSIYSDQTVPVGEVVGMMNIAKRNHYKVILATSPE